MNTTLVLVSKSDKILSLISFGMIFIRLVIISYLGFFILTFGVDNIFTITSMILANVVLDYYDGELFKKTSLYSISKWRVKRRLLDSLVDRLVIQISCISLLIIDLNFLPIYLFILLREIAVSGYCSIKIFQGYLLYPHVTAKLAGVFTAITFITYLVEPHYTFIPCTIMLYFSFNSFCDYWRRCKEIPKNLISTTELIEIF